MIGIDTNILLRLFETGEGPAQTDYLAAQLNLAFGRDTTLTFDKAAARSPAFRRLPV